jgi:hypothetical protein
MPENANGDVFIYTYRLNASSRNELYFEEVVANASTILNQVSGLKNCTPFRFYGSNSEKIGHFSTKH